MLDFVVAAALVNLTPLLWVFGLGVANSSSRWAYPIAFFFRVASITVGLYALMRIVPLLAAQLGCR